MGIFSVIAVLAVVFVTALAVFTAASSYLPFRGAFLVAISTTFAAAGGFVLGGLLQKPFYPETLQSTTAVIAYLGIMAASALIAGGVVGRLVWRFVRR